MSKKRTRVKAYIDDRGKWRRDCGTSFGPNLRFCPERSNEVAKDLDSRFLNLNCEPGPGGEAIVS